jgi:hypothetical protein
MIPPSTHGLINEEIKEVIEVKEIEKLWDFLVLSKR